MNAKEIEFMAIKSFSIRIDEEMLHKLHVVADYEGRSANGQVLVLIRDCIEAEIQAVREKYATRIRKLDELLGRRDT